MLLGEVRPGDIKETDGNRQGAGWVNWSQQLHPFDSQRRFAPIEGGGQEGFPDGGWGLRLSRQESEDLQADRRADLGVLS